MISDIIAALALVVAGIAVSLWRHVERELLDERRDRRAAQQEAARLRAELDRLRAAAALTPDAIDPQPSVADEAEAWLASRINRPYRRWEDLS